MASNQSNQGNPLNPNKSQSKNPINHRPAALLQFLEEPFQAVGAFFQLFHGGGVGNPEQEWALMAFNQSNQGNPLNPINHSPRIL